MGHGLLKKVNFYFIFSEKNNFPGKMPLKCSNNAQCFFLTKMLEKNASIMYKSLIHADLQRSGRSGHLDPEKIFFGPSGLRLV